MSGRHAGDPVDAQNGPLQDCVLSNHGLCPDIVHAFITERFTEPLLTLSETGYQELLATVAAGQILGGPAYDALIAFTDAEHNAILLTLDQRAAATYQAVGARVEQLLSYRSY